MRPFLYAHIVSVTIALQCLLATGCNGTSSQQRLDELEAKLAELENKRGSDAPKSDRQDVAREVVLLKAAQLDKVSESVQSNALLKKECWYVYETPDRHLVFSNGKSVYVQEFGPVSSSFDGITVSVVEDNLPETCSSDVVVLVHFNGDCMAMERRAVEQSLKYAVDRLNAREDHAQLFAFGHGGYATPQMLSDLRTSGHLALPDSFIPIVESHSQEE